MSDVCHKSLFVTELSIDIPNFLTELIIKNYLVWQKKPLPSSPFWRKDIARGNKNLEFLGKRYSEELAEINKLLLVFAPGVLSEHFTENGTATLRYLRKEFREKLAYSLVLKQIKYVKSITETPDVARLRLADDKVGVMKAMATGKNKMGLL